MKKRNTAGRSTLGLIASGAATIGIGQKMPSYHIRATGSALKQDQRSIRGDARRALSGSFDREFA